jgi:lipopolysaccharide/colanic/teichoic acid biosynthesis glycosyltransferase
MPDTDLYTETEQKKSTFRYSLQNTSNLIGKKITWQIPIIDFILVNIAYFGMQYYKRGTLHLVPHLYFNLLILFYVLWLVISLATGKFNLYNFPNLKNGFLVLGRCAVFKMYSLSFIVVIMGLYAYSRVQIFGTCILLFILEITAFAVFYGTIGKKIVQNHREYHVRILKFGAFSIPRFLFDFVLLVAAFFLVNYFKRDSFHLSDEYENLFFVVCGLWLVTSIFTRKFERRHYRNYYYAIAPHIKTVLLMMAIMSVLVFALRWFYYSRLQVFGTFTLFIVLEMITYYLWFITRSPATQNRDIETIEEIKQTLNREELPDELEHLAQLQNREPAPVRNRLKNKFLKDLPALYHFIEFHLDLNTIDERDTQVINTHTLYNIDTIDDHSLTLLVNLHRVNDFRWLNRYFLEIHKKIYNGGYFVTIAETINTHKIRIYRKYPKLFADGIYILHFIVHRVFPKLPGIQKVYFALTRGKNRLISKAEIMGRLYFCGFKVVAEKEINESAFIIAKRVRMPSLDKSPSYGPTIKLPRIGLQGEINYIHKFRTMYPYSEYLQEYVFEKNKLQSGGKFNNDFRLTEWGGFMRKLWLDELPQIINFFRGDLNLVGVRALSQHYFSLYPQDLQQLRIQFKPGLVPPFYADMPKSLAEIIASERKYLARKQKHPFTTDIKYFFKAWYNILFRHARSA